MDGNHSAALIAERPTHKKETLFKVSKVVVAMGKKSTELANKGPTSELPVSSLLGEETFDFHQNQTIKAVTS